MTQHDVSSPLRGELTPRGSRIGSSASAAANKRIDQTPAGSNKFEPAYAGHPRGVMKELRKPGLCPECGCTTIKRIVGGRPSDDGMKMVEAAKPYRACLMREWKENWYCTRCKHQWCDKTEPIRIEMEQLYSKLKKELKS